MTNPMLRTLQPLLPPSARSRAALGLTAAAALGRFELQVCGDCGAVQYPPRESCQRCLSGALRWREQSGAGELIAAIVMLFVSYLCAVFYADRVSARTMIIAVAVLNVVVLLGPPLFSTDMFSYQAYARMFATLTYLTQLPFASDYAHSEPDYVIGGRNYGAGNERLRLRFKFGLYF